MVEAGSIVAYVHGHDPSIMIVLYSRKIQIVDTLREQRSVCGHDPIASDTVYTSLGISYI